MKSRHGLLCAGLAFLLASCSSAIAQTPAPTAQAPAPTETPTSFSFMLPRTVLDVTITYTYDSCYVLERDGKKTNNYVFKTVSTVSARAIPDTYLHVRSIETSDIAKAVWADHNFSITTFPGTHILSSVGTHNTDQTSQIVGNVLTGVAKIASIAFPGGMLLAAEFSKDGKPVISKPMLRDKCDAADDPNAEIEKSKAAIAELQKELRGDKPTGGANVKISEGEKPQDTMARIQALQALMTQDKTDQIITLKATIDPGYTAVDNTPTSEDNFPPLPPKPSHLKAIADAPAQIGSFIIPKDKLKKIFTEQINAIDAKYPDKTAQQSAEDDFLQRIIDNTHIYVYLDFPNAETHNGLPTGKPKQTLEYAQERVEGHDNDVTYREPRYIPVLLWRGQWDAAPNPKVENPARQIIPPQLFAFAQYGLMRVVPYLDEQFHDDSWTVKFNDNGEVIDGELTAKSTVANMTSLFSTAASNAETIYSQLQPFRNAQAHAAETQAEADEIYQTTRLATCETQPAICPSK